MADPKSGRVAGDREPGISACVARELREELVLSTTDSYRVEQERHLKFVGLINDDTSASHVAFVYQYEVAEDGSGMGAAAAFTACNDVDR